MGKKSNRITEEQLNEAESLQFIFEPYGFKYWKKYLEEKENGMTVIMFEFD